MLAFVGTIEPLAFHFFSASFFSFPHLHNLIAAVRVESRGAGGLAKEWRAHKRSHPSNKRWPSFWRSEFLNVRSALQHGIRSDSAPDENKVVETNDEAAKQ
jgi:hypothetical protein